MSVSPPGAGAPPAQRLCITFSVDGAVRYISGLDMARVWVRAFRRMGLPLSYSHGFNPHPRLSAAAPLPVGFAAERELLEAYFDTPVATQEMAARLPAALPAGLTVLCIEPMPLTAPPLASRLQAADYVISFLDPPPDDLPARLEHLLAAESLPFTRVRQAKETRFDLRPRILQARIEECTGQPLLALRLVHGPGGAARPEDVLMALGLSPEGTHITRSGLVF